MLIPIGPVMRDANANATTQRQDTPNSIFGVDDDQMPALNT
jgi:hypothetical protein